MQRLGQIVGLEKWRRQRTAVVGSGSGRPRLREGEAGEV